MNLMEVLLKKILIKNNKMKFNDFFQKLNNNVNI